jgi:hypothetical protein
MRFLLILRPSDCLPRAWPRSYVIMHSLPAHACSLRAAQCALLRPSAIPPVPSCPCVLCACPCMSMCVLPCHCRACMPMCVAACPSVSVCVAACFRSMVTFWHNEWGSSVKLASTRACLRQRGPTCVNAGLLASTRAYLRQRMDDFHGCNVSSTCHYCVIDLEPISSSIIACCVKLESLPTAIAKVHEKRHLSHHSLGRHQCVINVSLM